MALRQNRQGSKRRAELHDMPARNYVHSDENGTVAYWYRMPDGEFYFRMYTDDGLSRAARYATYGEMVRQEPLMPGHVWRSEMCPVPSGSDGIHDGGLQCMNYAGHRGNHQNEDTVWTDAGTTAFIPYDPENR